MPHQRRAKRAGVPKVGAPAPAPAAPITGGTSSLVLDGTVSSTPEPEPEPEPEKPKRTTRRQSTKKST